MTAPCHEGTAVSQPRTVSQECRDWAKAMGDTFAQLTAEAQRVAIREALATW